PRPPAVTGQEPPVPPDGGDCVVSSASAQAALLAGHPRVSVLAGGVAAWPGELEQGAVELQKTKTSLEPRLGGGRRGEKPGTRLPAARLTILDVRKDEEFSGRVGYPCDPRQGHIPGA